MSDKIQPKYVDGEPVCTARCYYFGLRGRYSLKQCPYISENDPCIPALRRDRDKLKAELAECKAENERLRERLKKFTEVDVCALHGFRDNEEGTCPQCSANFWKSEYEQYLNYLELVANVLLEQIPDSNVLEKIYGILKKAELI